MQLRNATEDDWLQAIEVANRDYDGNLRLHPNAAEGSMRLSVWHSSGPGARRSHTGRRIASACWHAHRDVMRALFDAVPDAKMSTSAITYNGKDDFLSKYPATGYRNIGSQAWPMEWQNACDC